MHSAKFALTLGRSQSAAQNLPCLFLHRRPWWAGPDSQACFGSFVQLANLTSLAFAVILLTNLLVVVASFRSKPSELASRFQASGCLPSTFGKSVDWLLTGEEKK
jgi:hypothetical protein